MVQRVGIIGGSFNPVHIAHLIIADRFTEQMELEQTFFVPAYRSPFKLEEDPHEIATAQQRVEMLRLAIEGHPKFAIEEYEVRRGGVSYTVDTVQYFRQKFPDAQLFLLIGSDQAAAFTKWYQWEEILQQVQLCIARRPFAVPPDIERALTYTLTYQGKVPVWIDAPLLAISATMIRQRVQQGKSIRYLVPAAVERYINEHRLYVDEGIST